VQEQVKHKENKNTALQKKFLTGVVTSVTQGWGQVHEYSRTSLTIWTSQIRAPYLFAVKNEAKTNLKMGASVILFTQLTIDAALDVSRLLQ